MKDALHTTFGDMSLAERPAAASPATPEPLPPQVQRMPMVLVEGGLVPLGSPEREENAAPVAGPVRGHRYVQRLHASAGRRRSLVGTARRNLGTAFDAAADQPPVPSMTPARRHRLGQGGG